MILRLAILLVFLNSCSKEGPVDPPFEERGPRTYTWVRDTLGNGSRQSSLVGLWGSSPTDVYAVGHSSDFYAGKIWHYDGRKWNDLLAAYPQAFPGRQLFYFAPAGVYGFGPNDVWIVGRRDTSTESQSLKKGFIMHFANGTWTGYWLPTSFNHERVWGASSSDLWVGGFCGQLFHFNGSSWQESYLPDSVIINQIEGISSTRVFASGSTYPNGLGYHRYYEWNGSAWTRIESRYANDPGPGYLPAFAIDDGDLVSTNYQIVTKRISQGVWQEVFRDNSASLGNLRVIGSSSIIAVGNDAASAELVYHYNGTDWARLIDIKNPNTTVYRIWSDGTEVFLLSWEAGASSTFWPRNFVLHGK